MSEKEIELPNGLDVDTATEVLQEYGSTDDAQIVKSETLDSLKAEIKEAKEAFAAVLEQESPQSAETLARQDMDALTEPFRDEEGEIDVDTLRQVPETGDVDTDTPEEPEVEGFDIDSLSRDDIEKLDLLAQKRKAFDNRGVPSRVDSLEAEMAEVAGVEDFEDIELEAL